MKEVLNMCNIIDVSLKWKKDSKFGKNTPKNIIIHHALHNKCTIQDVHRWHLDKGWAGFGYHFFVDKHGAIYKGRNIEWNGAHCKENGMNENSIGICVEGCYTDYSNMTEKNIHPIQYNSLINLVKYLINKYKIKTVYPHSYFAKYKDCPGKYFPFTKLLADITKVEKEEWKQILMQETISGEKWIEGFQKAMELSSKYKELECFRYVPDLIKKLYSR
jgi:N-acetyl-anhydromuramyl-L-alanine amidase AmpD